MTDNFDFSRIQSHSINGKNIYIVDKHHFTLPIWADFSISTNAKYNLVTFDFHTDTRQAFTLYACLEKSGLQFGFSDRETFRQSYIKNINPKDINEIINATKHLAHDEHIFAALDFGYISQAHVINLQGKPYDHHISYYQTSDFFSLLPLEAFMNPYESEYKSLKAYRLNRLEDDYINDTKFDIPSAPFILDFDLDYFPTRESLEPKNRKVITNLILKAQIITIAREEFYFQKNREQLGFDVKEAEELLLKLIETVTA
jgi:hypothetical protein